MDRIYMNRIDGQRRIHIEIHDHEISDLLEDLQADPEHYDSTRAFLAILDAAEETFSPVVAEGRRDRAARTAARQTTGQDDTKPLATPCGYCAHTLNWHTPGGRCQLNSGPNGCGCTTFVAPNGSHPDHPHHAPAVGQPAEAHDTDARPPRVQWRVEGYDADVWLPVSRSFDSSADAHARKHADTRYPDMPTRVVRETTTWTVEGER